MDRGRCLTAEKFFNFPLARINPDTSSPMKVAVKLFILHEAVAATFFRPCLGGAQLIAYRDVAFDLRGRIPKFR